MSRRIALAVLAAAAFVAGCKASESSPSASDSTVAKFLAEQHLDGQVVFLQFANCALDCQKSREGLEAMIRLSRDGTIPGVTFARVEGCPDDVAVNDYYATKRCGFNVLRDKDGAAAKAFDAGVIPTFVLADKFGRVRYRGGFPDEKKLAEWAQELKGQTADAGADATLFGAASLKPAALLAATKLPDLKDVVKPLADYKTAGGLVIVFADISCPFAESALGELPTVSATLATHRVAAVVVNISDPKDDVLATYAKRNTGTPVLYDATDATKESWKVDSVPTVVFVNANGQVGYRGNAVWKNLGEAVDKSLGLAPGTVKFQAEGTGFG